MGNLLKKCFRPTTPIEVIVTPGNTSNDCSNPEVIVAPGNSHESYQSIDYLSPPPAYDSIDHLNNIDPPPAPLERPITLANNIQVIRLNNVDPSPAPLERPNYLYTSNRSSYVNLGDL
jgi:hypothetical protein